MHYQRKIGFIILSVICYLLTLISTALGNPQIQPQTNSSISVPESDTVSPQLPVDTQPLPATDGSTNIVQPNIAGTDLLVDTETLVPLDQPVKTNKTNLMSKILSATKGLVGRAMSWLGTRYVWGGVSKKGVDCSGLTRLLYMNEGIRLPHSARLQYKLGRKVASGALLPGDLVFFNTRGPVSHVGMYIGNNKFVHAANPRRGVRVDSLRTPYYHNRFAGARRYKRFW